MSRRNFIKTSGIVTAGLALSPSVKLFAENNNFKSQRPPVGSRNFTSKAVEAKIKEVKKNINNDELAWMFENCFPNTLDTTVDFKMINGKPYTFVITGDIDAMWLRDSSAQVCPYIPLCKEDEKLKKLIAGVINKQAEFILIDPYANAFNNEPDPDGYWQSDMTEMKPELHERKWEIDSLCYPIRLSYGFWKETGDTSCFDETWFKAVNLIYDTFIEQQRKENNGPYTFQRLTENPKDTAPNGGYGNPVNPVGLICSIFRPSDDATIFPFLIPSNLFAVISLRQAAEILIKIYHKQETANKFLALADEVEKAIKKFGVVEHEKFGKMYAFEVDGFGSKLFIDDANVPSLLSLPYLGVCSADDEIYKNTRNFILSNYNPYFFVGKAAEGTGGPHTGIDKIWPMSITLRALTSKDDDEIKRCLTMLQKTHAQTGFMHESFNKDNPKDFTRKWFAWANTLFGELILKLYNEKPKLLKFI
ncbi:MAG: metal-independent alpha-mannosidase [Ignavibacteriae bacterium]|nr:MAG: metal-independent alpha-mannosidase [Ignavibacteriota bacterium]